MKTPNLIMSVKNKEIDEIVFNDLELCRVLSDSDIRFLRSPCDANEICRRQEIFRSMENEEFYNALMQCYAAICTYEKERSLMRSAKNVLEEYCSVVHILEAYIALLECVKQLSGYCNAADQVADYFLLKEKAEVLSSIKDNISEMNSILLDISKSSLSFQMMDYIENGHNSLTYIDIICRCAKALRLDVFRQDSKSIPFDDALIDALKRLNEEKFALMSSIEQQHNEELNYNFSDLKSQIQFVINIWSLVQKASSKGIPHTIPHISKNKEIRINEAYSVSLIAKDIDTFVPNNIFFDEETSFYFVTGANGGGKTEYLRALGTNLILFLSGCPIFAKSAIIYPFTALFTHFPKDERFESVGRLEEESNRVNQMLRSADSNSVLLFNETFGGTDQQCGLSMLLHVVDHLHRNQMFGLVVTHLRGIEKEKYAILCPEVIQKSDGNNLRTYRMVRKASESESYAKDIIRKYKLDQESLQKKKAVLND